MNAIFLCKILSVATTAFLVGTGVHNGCGDIIDHCNVPVYDNRIECSRSVDDGSESVATVTIETEDKTFVYKDNKIVPSDFTVEEEIAVRRINASLEKKLELVDTYLQKGAGYKTALGVCFPLLIRTVNQVSEHLFKEAVDSQIKYEGGKFFATKEESGRVLDENRLYGGIYYSLRFGGGGTVKATTAEVKPRVTQKELNSRLVLRSEYVTDYSTSTNSRAKNVALALGKFDGLCIESGRSVSFNQTVGERTKENGFESAKIIVDGQYTEGIGGGVCQASTAIYNAALLSDLVCKANAHSISPSYCPPGLDAMISSYSDLVIYNKTDHPVYISVTNSNGRGTVRIYGAPKEYEVKPESVVTKTVRSEELEVLDTERKYFDEQSVSGDRLMVSPGKDGCECETYLKYYKNGIFVKRVKIRQNTYKSLPRVIAIAP